jgi:uroporphyrinogen decarboxylase
VGGLWTIWRERFAWSNKQTQRLLSKIKVLSVVQGISGKAAGKAVLRVLGGERLPRPPIWVMRQAGRYLPEYRALRTQAKNFLDFCYRPELACEATLQPIRRYGFDAAILFSDILVVPDALGQEVSFVEGEGPRLAPVTDGGGLAKLHDQIDLERLEPVFETIDRVRTALDGSTTFLGFCGAPWTVASYMVAGRGTPELAPSRLKAYRDPDFMTALIDRLVEASITYLLRQFEAGVDAVQIFESFAGSLTADGLARWSLGPIERIIQGVRAVRPDAPIIVFARGAGAGQLRVARELSANAIGLDWAVDEAWAATHLQPLRPVQGHLDPLLLVAGGEALDRRVDAIVTAFSQGPHIFNLGHGIVPETPPEHVARMVARVRGRS